jgi:hypothetical protein
MVGSRLLTSPQDAVSAVRLAEIVAALAVPDHSLRSTPQRNNIPG